MDILQIVGTTLGVIGIALIAIAYALPWFEKKEEEKRRKILKSAEIYVFPTETVRKVKNER